MDLTTLEMLFLVVPSKGEQLLLLIGTAVLAAAGALFGGLSVPEKALLWLMAADYAVGMIASIYRREWSAVKASGGIGKKALQWAVVWVSAMLDAGLGTDFLRGAVVGSLLLNEAGSILENLSRLPCGDKAVPRRLIEMLEILKDRRGLGRGGADATR